VNEAVNTGVFFIALKDFYTKANHSRKLQVQQQYQRQELPLFQLAFVPNLCNAED
jgi:hypothetical protein